MLIQAYDLGELDEKCAESTSKKKRGWVCKVCETKLYMKDFHGKLDRKIVILDKEIRGEKNETKALLATRAMVRAQVQNINNEILEQQEQHD